MTNKSSHPYRKYVLSFWGLYVGGLILTIILFVSIANGNMGFMPSFSELENPEINEASQIISNDGVVLGQYFDRDENRVNVTFEEISPHMTNALVAIEDQRYYKHSGIDFRGLARVIIKSLLLGQDTGGGSTITQQLGKQLFPRENYQGKPIKFAMRKFKEWVIAIKLEKSFSKNEIIALYLNKFDFLNNGDGILTASRVYFNTTPSELQVEEAAMLAAMAKNPSAYNPRRFEENALARRNLVLGKMKTLDYIEPAIADSALSKDIVLDFQKVDHKVGLATYYRERLRSTLQEKKPKNKEAAAEWDANPIRGWLHKNFKKDGTPYDIYKDGLKIYSTLDSRMQRYAEEAVIEHIRDDLQPSIEREYRNLSNPPFDNTFSKKETDEFIRLARLYSERYRVHQLQKLSNDSIRKLFETPVEMRIFSWDGEIDTVMSPNDSIRYYKRFLRAGLMSVDPHNGQVRAYVGGIDYTHFQYDQVMQGRRQVGSIFKPFVYTLAMQHGYSPCYEIPNVPVQFKFVSATTGKDTIYEPKFSHHELYDGKMVTLKKGLAKSMNQVSAWVIKRYNPQAVIDLARKMGVQSPIDPVWPICVGSAELPVYEVVGAFTTFANKGIWIEPILVTRIEDKDGNLISTFQPREEEAISEFAAYKMLNLMQGVTEGDGTGIRLRFKYNFDNPIAGKTGTTNDNADGWFMGIVPDLVTGTWSGGEDMSIRFRNDQLGQGANMALPMWALYMQKIYADSTLNISKEDFEKPLNFDLDLDCERVNQKKINKEVIDDFDEDF